MRECFFCQHKYDIPEALYCPKCGSRAVDADKQVSAADRLKFWGGESRILSVFFVDFAGLDMMIDRKDDQNVMLSLRKCLTDVEDIIHEFNGTSNRIIPDNRILGIFGAPKAHKDDPLRSIKCAWSIKNWWMDIKPKIDLLKHVELTIGANTGRAFFGYLLEEASFLTVIGDTINTAARLTEMCPPNEMIIADDIYNRVIDYVEVEHIGERSVKGKKTKVDIYRVTEIKAPTEEAKVQKIPFCGRQKELDQLKNIVDNTRENKIELCIISGQMGIGKSRLKEEFEKYLAEEAYIKYYETHCSADIQSPYYPFKFLFARYFEINEYDNEEVILKKIDDIITRKQLSPLVAQGLRYLFLTDLRRIKQDEMLTINEEVYTSVKNLIRHECRNGPLVLIFEEFNKADDMSKYLVSYLVSELKDDPVMFLMVNVSKEFVANIEASIQELNLSPLSFGEIKELVLSLLGNADDNLAQFMYKSAGGNPLFTIEAIRNTRRTKVIKKIDGRWVLEKDQHLSFLDDLYGVVMSTIDSLPSRYRLIVDYASVVGYSFSYRILDGLLKEHNLDEQLDYLVREGYIIMSKDGNDPIYVFRHNLLKDAAYTVLPLRKRREIHRLVAGLFEELYKDQLSTFYENIAHHYMSCDDFEKAASYFGLAGDKAKNLFAVEQAIEFYDTVLRIDQGAGNTVAPALIRNVMLNLADLYEITGEIDKMKKISEQGRTSAHNDEDIAGEINFLERYAYALYLTNNFPKAEETLLLALDQCSDDMAETRSILYSNLGLLYQARNEYEKSILHYNLSWHTARDNNIEKGEILCLMNLAQLHKGLGNFEQALEYLDYGLKELISKNDIRRQMQFKYIVADVYLNIWALEQAGQLLHECLDIADSLGNIETYLKSCLDIAMISALQDDVKQTNTYLDLADARISIIQRESLLADINLKKAKVYFVAGNEQRAYDFSMSALKIAQRLVKRDVEFECYRLLSFVQPDKALDNAMTAMKIAEEIKMPPLIAAGLFRLTQVSKEADDLEKARHYGRKALLIHDDIKLKLKSENQKIYAKNPEYFRLLEM